MAGLGKISSQSSGEIVGMVAVGAGFGKGWVVWGVGEEVPGAAEPGGGVGQGLGEDPEGLRGGEEEVGLGGGEGHGGSMVVSWRGGKGKPLSL